MIEQLGYYFHPTRRAGSSGHPQLDINLYGEATQKHFDPEKLTFWAINSGGDVTRTTVTHPWHGEQQLRLCAGRMAIVDRTDKKVEAFSLGGDLAIMVHDTHTRCELTSSAPIIHLQETQTMPTLLVSEFEAMLARLRAGWGGDDTGFRKKLATIEPFTLFVAGLAAIQERLAAAPTNRRGQSYQQAAQLINQTIRTVQANDRWPASPPDLSDLL